MNGCWFLFTTGERTSCGPVVSSCVLTASDGFHLELTLDASQRGIGALMEEAYRRQPSLDFYGWLADDTFPATPGWDRLLAEAAIGRGFACASDGGYIDGDTVRAGGDLSSGLCWAGWLIRAVGWWCPPGLRDAYIDTAWLEIMRPLGLVAYLDEVEVTHRHWRTGARPQDEIDLRAAQGIERDWARFELLCGGELAEARRRIVASAP